MSKVGKTLPLWGELIGVLRGLSTDEEFTYVKVGDYSLAFRKGSDEAIIIERELADIASGRTVAILRTDIPGKPLLVRTIESIKSEVEKP